MFGFLKKKQTDFKAECLPAGDVLEVKSGETLLKAALAAGLDWPHDCRVGMLRYLSLSPERRENQGVG